MEIIMVGEEVDVAEARRIARRLAQASKLSSHNVEKAAIFATEAATNLIKYAGHGKILINSSQAVVDFLVLDKGPGIPNIDLAMRDGYSTSGSQGSGLGAMSRLTSHFDLYSQPGNR